MIQAPRRIVVEDLPNSTIGWRVLRIFVDGERMSNVISYDIDEGFVIRVKLDDEGRVLVCGDEVVTEFVHGIVRVEQSEPSNA